MEGVNLETAQSVFGKYFIGPTQVEAFFKRIGLTVPLGLEPRIPFSLETLQKKAKSHILILFVPQSVEGRSISIRFLRDCFGVDPAASEPCFYNQDWYINERFANESHNKPSWHLVGRGLVNHTRGKVPFQDLGLPSALILAYSFFITATCIGELLFSDDFVWCSDKDANGDRIYVGRYYDPLGIAKNGFSIHRHLSITEIYGSIDFA